MRVSGIGVFSRSSERCRSFLSLEPLRLRLLLLEPPERDLERGDLSLSLLLRGEAFDALSESLFAPPSSSELMSSASPKSAEAPGCVFVTSSSSLSVSINLFFFSGTCFDGASFESESERIFRLRFSTTPEAFESCELLRDLPECLVDGEPLLDLLDDGDPLLDLLDDGEPLLDSFDAGDPLLDRFDAGDPLLERFDAGDPLFDRWDVGEPECFDAADPVCFEAGEPLFDR